MAPRVRRPSARVQDTPYQPAPAAPDQTAATAQPAPPPAANPPAAAPAVEAEAAPATETAAAPEAAEAARQKTRKTGLQKTDPVMKVILETAGLQKYYKIQFARGGAGGRRSIPRACSGPGCSAGMPPPGCRAGDLRAFACTHAEGR